jgi:hypothetical protein
MAGGRETMQKKDGGRFGIACLTIKKFETGNLRRLIGDG